MPAAVSALQLRLAVGVLAALSPYTLRGWADARRRGAQLGDIAAASHCGRSIIRLVLDGVPEPPTELDAAAIAGAWADGLPLGQIGALSQVRTELMVARLRRSGIDLSTRG